MMEEELASLKRSLISLVVSSPTTMTVNTLVKDYRNMVGGALPVAKFGYRDYITFLRERCQDIFVLEGPQWDPILTPKITKNLKHIDQMVQRQRVQSSTRYKGKRRSVPGSISNNQPFQTNTNLIASTFNKKRDQTHTQTPVYRETGRETPIAKAISKTTPVKETYESRSHDIQNQNSNNNHNSLDSDTDCNKLNNNNNDKEKVRTDTEESRPSSALSKFYKKRLPHYNSDMDFPSPDADLASKGSADSGGRSSTCQSSSKAVYREDLKNEIVELIKDSPQGVWFTDLMRLYKERYGRELNYSRCGFTSLGNLVSGLTTRVAVSRPEPTGDYLLQEPGAAPAARAPRPRPAAARRAAAAPRDPDDALPGIQFEADVFPADCMHYMDSIPALGARALAAAAPPPQVLVAEVYSPSHFWLLRVSPDHSQAMEAVMDDMNVYYRGEGAGRVLARGALRVGHHCAAEYEGHWHRALIVHLVDSDTVKVRHVDYGTVERVPARALRPLRREWGALPAQAVRARLAAVRPAAAGARWPRAAAAAFLARVRDTRLYANVVAVDYEEDVVETFLIDTGGAEDACVSRELVRAGHADLRADCALGSEEPYLRPTFEALESGATPNYADICRMLADGIALEYVDAYRRHVPDPWAAPPPPPPPPPPPAADVVLSEAEGEVLAHLRRSDPAAANWFMLANAWREVARLPPGLF